MAISETTYTVYLCRCEGIDRDNKPRTFWMHHDSYISGCNPNHWHDYGSAYDSEEDLRAHVKYAGGSWLLKSLDMSTLTFIKRVIETKTKTTETIL